MMLKSMYKIRRQRLRYYSQGFTLIEMIVVLVIIGIVASMALIAFSHFGESQNLAQQTQLTQGVLNYVRQDAIVNQNVSGVRFVPNGFQLVLLNADHQFMDWNPVESSSHVMKKVAYTLYKVQGNNKEKKLQKLANGAIIAFSPSGRLYHDPAASFQLILTLHGDRHKTLAIKNNGVVSIEDQADHAGVKHV